MRSETLKLCAPCARSKPLKLEVSRPLFIRIRESIGIVLKNFRKQQVEAAEISAATQKQRDETLLKFGHLMNRF